MKLDTNTILLLAGAAAAIIYFRGENEKKNQAALALAAAAAKPASPAIKGSVSVGPGGVDVNTDVTLPGGGT